MFVPSLLVKYTSCWLNLHVCTCLLVNYPCLVTYDDMSQNPGILPCSWWMVDDSPFYMAITGFSPCILTGWWFQPTPLKNMSSSVGMMKFPLSLYGKIKHVPNHQPVNVTGAS